MKQKSFFQIGFKKKKIRLRNYKLCDNFFSRARGLMFRRNPQNLVFVFKKPVNEKIHSFFVFQKFLAIWMKKGRIVDVKLVEPWRFRISSKKPFDTLIEIPFKSNQGNFGFSSENEKHLNTLKTILDY